MELPAAATELVPVWRNRQGRSSRAGGAGEDSSASGFRITHEEGIRRRDQCAEAWNLHRRRARQQPDGSAGAILPSIIVDNGAKASERFFTFFTDTIRNKNTRMRLQRGSSPSATIEAANSSSSCLRPEFAS